jgi:hypothetical protein
MAQRRDQRARSAGTAGDTRTKMGASDAPAAAKVFDSSVRRAWK